MSDRAETIKAWAFVILVVPMLACMFLPMELIPEWAGPLRQLSDGFNQIIKNVIYAVYEMGA